VEEKQQVVKNFASVPDNTPILVGAGQYTEHIDGDEPALNPPMELAARAARNALQDTHSHLTASDIESIAAVRLFSDSVPTWACPFGKSDNPPEAVAQRIGANPTGRIYSNAGGTQPLKLLAELCTDIARGEIGCALLTGAEAIASQRYAQRNGLEPDWNEPCDLAMDSREYSERFASRQELGSGMYLPVHYYALIENLRAHQQGNNPDQHRAQMTRLFAPLSQVARDNPYAFWPVSRTVEELREQSDGNYPICLPYSKLLIAQDAVNQAAAVLVTSAGLARERGIDPQRWVFLRGYAEGFDHYLTQRVDPGKSQSMEDVFAAALDSAEAQANDMSLLDIYSCFPCAVEAACDALAIPWDSGRALTVTGGLPYFGGPGSNYSLHAIAEMVWRLRNSEASGLVTANGGQLSKHAALVLAGNPTQGTLDLAEGGPTVLTDGAIPAVPYADSPKEGRVISYTVIYERKRDDLAVVLGETANGSRFLARSAAPATVSACLEQPPIGRAVRLSETEGRFQFELAD